MTDNVMRPSGESCFRNSLSSWKLEVFPTSQHRILLLKCGSIKENLPISLLRKSHHLWLVTQLTVVQSCRRSRLTVLPLYQDLDHGSLFQFHLRLWIILTSSCLADGFRRLFPWSCSTPFRSAPILSPSFRIPVFLIPSEPSAQSHILFSNSSSVRPRPPLAVLSTNTQSQVSDIHGISTHNALSVYFGSFNTQSKTPDITSLSMSVSIQELSGSFNTQDQAPDSDKHSQG